ncbi:MAG: hypothetical protein HY812_14595 [Planctomycetes bacterium]|nr:hypothetical protein [Planctomycetota bacterium]
MISALELALLLGSFALPAPLAGEEALAPAVSSEGEVAPHTEYYEAPRTVSRAPSAEKLAGPRAATFFSVDEHPEADMPREVAFLPSGLAAVIANTETDMLTFFDVSSKSITHSVTVGDYPVDVAVQPAGPYAVVPCVFSNAVWVIDTSTHSVAASVPVTGLQPYQVRVTKNGQYAVVGVINDALNSAFSIIDLTTLTEVRSIPSAPQGVIGWFATPESGISGSLFTQFALSADNKTIVLPARTGTTVELYDLTTGASIASLPVPALPSAVDVSTDGTVAVVSHEGTNQAISVIDLVTPAVSATFPTGNTLYNQLIRISADKQYAIASLLNNVIFVNLTTGAVTANLATGSPGDIALTYDGKYAFVSNLNARVIDVASQTIVKTITYQACADAAASPVSYRVAALNNRFREDVLLFNVNGASGFAEGMSASGEQNEGDATRTLALTQDGMRLVAANNVSRNAVVVDLSPPAISGYPAAGDRPLGVAVSPNGLTAVVANGDQDTVSIIDLATNQTVAQLAVAQRPSEVLISPDSQWAYVTTIAGTDRLHFIHLNGAASSVVKSLVTGQMGSIIYTYNVISGMALSPDGAVLVLCISFDDQLMVVDTQNQVEIARLATGDFPVRALFGPGGSYCYVANSFSDNVDVFQISLASQTKVKTVGTIEFPLTLTCDAAGSYVYAGSFDYSFPHLAVIDVAAGHVHAGQIPLSSQSRAAHFSPLTSTLYVATTGGQLVRIAAAGPLSTTIDSTPLTGSPSDMVFSETLRLAVAAEPGAQDGVDLVQYTDECPGSITNHGFGCAGSGGFVPALALSGCVRDGGTINVALTQALGGSFAVLFFGLSQAAIPMNGGCFLNLYPVLPVQIGLPLLGSGPGAGHIAFNAVVPPGLPAFTVDLQAFVAEPSLPHGFSNTNGVELTKP